MKQISFYEDVSWHRVELWQIDNILEKMSEVSSLTHVWVMVDHKLHTAAKIIKVKVIALIFQ